jgi:hypothetical protein
MSKGTHKAITWGPKEPWAKIANESLKRTGDEGRAIRKRMLRSRGNRPVSTSGLTLAK